VIGVLDGKAPGPAVMFCGHLDTVGVEGMVDPFTPRTDQGRLYGRGAQDMKGGVAAMIAAAAVLAPTWSRGRLIVAGVADEEHLSLGAEALVRDWRADMAIVTEPTDLRLAIGHKGFAWAEVVTRGRAAHGSRPEEGRDAIARMGRLLVAPRSARSRVAGATGRCRFRAPDRCTRRSFAAVTS
jgi:acetylornithine deacetylase